MNTLIISVLQLEGGVKRLVINYIDEANEPQTKLVDYDALSASDKATVDAYESISNVLMNA